MSTARYASSTWAIIPVKPLRESKTRLSCIMSAAQRAELVLNFLQHNLHVLRQVSAIDRILVISSDPEILQYARQHGALTLDEEQPHGLNVAVLRAVHYAAAKRATAALILPVDLPLMQPEDIEVMIYGEVKRNGSGRPEEPGMILCADKRRNGTNALFIHLPTRFTFRYGAGSFQRHLQEGVHLGLNPQVVHIPRLALDIDMEEDWSEYQQILSARKKALSRSIR